MGIELSQEEIHEFTQQAPRCILCVNREGLAPLPVPMWFAYIEGKLYMHTLLSSKKVPHLRKDPKVAVVVESGEHYFTLRAVLFMGHCDVIDDQDEVRHWMHRIREEKPLYKELTPEQWPPHLERLYEKPRALLRITPHSVTTWDFAKIRR